MLPSESLEESDERLVCVDDTFDFVAFVVGGVGSGAGLGGAALALARLLQLVAAVGRRRRPPVHALDAAELVAAAARSAALAPRPCRPTSSSKSAASLSTKFYSIILGFYLLSLGLAAFIGFYWILLGFYLVSLSFTGFYWVLLGFIGFYWVLLGFTGFYWVLPGLSGF